MSRFSSNSGESGGRIVFRPSETPTDGQSKWASHAREFGHTELDEAAPATFLMG